MGELLAHSYSAFQGSIFHRQNEQISTLFIVKNDQNLRDF